MIAQHDFKTVRQMIDLMAESRPEACFLIGPETGGVITFLELQRQSRFLSAGFLRDGVAPGDKIALLLDNGLGTAQLFLGVMYSGFVAVPLNVGAGISQLSYTLEHSDARVVYAGENYRALIDDVTSHVQSSVRVIFVDSDSLPAVSETPPWRDLPDPQPEDPALLMYTSGSTGEPKAAIHSHRTILAGARNSVSAHQLSPADRSLLVLPLYHINAECVTLIPTLMTGGSVVVPRRFTVSRFWDWLDEYQCTWSALVPTIISQLLDWRDPRADDRGAAFGRIRFLRSSSAPLAPALHREFLDKFNLLLIQAMGCSEAGNVFSNPLPPGKNKIGSPGVPWGFEVRIVDRDGLDLATGESGEVVFRGPAVMQGYYKQPEETAAVMDSDGWFHTGDLAYRDPDGYFFVVGRSKDLIIKAGVNIAPRQIDDVLESYPGVLEAAATGVPDHHLGEDVVAFVVLRAGIMCDERELLTFCESRLGTFKTPRRIYFTRDLPKGPSGKVQRLRLKDDAVQLAKTSSASSDSAHGKVPATPAEMPPAPTSIEQVIANVWMKVLSQPNVNSDSNFFELGGHSLLAMQCLSLLRDKLPITLSLSDFFEHATLAAQVALVKLRLTADTNANARDGAPVDGTDRESSSPDPATFPVCDRALPCSLSPAQQRLWFMDQLNSGSPVYNEAEAVRLLGELNVGAMERALNVIVGRHEMLRTTFHVTDSQPSMVVHDNWALRVNRIDLSALAATERQSEVERMLIAEPQRLFHLEKEPAIRVTLLRLEPGEHVLILMMHHLICDRSSFGIIWREMAALYRAFCRRESFALPTSPIWYGEYVAWRRQQDAGAGSAEDLSFWVENLRGAPQMLELPADRPRQMTVSYHGTKQRFRLPPVLTKDLRALSQREKASPFTVFAAVLNALLYRYTGQEDIVLGVPVADREMPELQSLVGFLVHTHVLRTSVTGETTFIELLSRVQKGMRDLYRHRAVAFDQVVRKLQLERSQSHSPLFQVMINWRDRDLQLPFIGLEGLAIEPLLAQSRTSKNDITVFVTDGPDEILLELEYNTYLFDDERIVRMVGHYQTMLEAVAQNPDWALAELPIQTPAEVQQTLTEWNRTQSDFRNDCTLCDLFEEQVQRTPHAVAAIFENERLTYSQLNDRADDLAMHLLNLGVGPDVLVGVCVERSLEMIVSLLGVLKSRGAYVPMDPAYPADRLAFMVEDCRPRVLLTQKKLQTRIPATQIQTIWLEDFSRATHGNDRLRPPGRRFATDDLAYVLYTSGSTGRPKGVPIRNQALVNFLTAMQRQPGIRSDDIMLAVTTLSFDIAGLELFLPLVSGACVVIASREATMDGVQLASLLKGCGATLMQATPATWRLLLDAGWSGSTRLKILCGGEAWGPELAQELLPRCESLWNMYGPTETTIWSSVAQVTAGKPISIGHPIANTTFYVLDANWKPVPVGIPGELYIGGVGLADGYLNRPDLTAERFVSDPFSEKSGAKLYRTGDVVVRSADGNLLFLRRLDQQVKIRGFRIELEEIESVLLRHPRIAQCAVVAREGAQGDKRLVAYSVPVEPRVRPLAMDLRSFLGATLPDYMIPAAFVVLDKFPLTPNGKIDRKALPEPGQFMADTRTNRQACPPRTPREFELVKIWEQVLGNKVTSVRDSFFDLGGHSLLAVQMFAQIEKQFGMRLPLAALYRAPAIEDIERILSGEVAASGWSSLVPIQVSGSRPPFFCVHGGGGNVLIYRELSRHLGPDQPFYGLQSEGLDGCSPLLQTIEEMAAHYLREIRTIQPRGPYFLGGYCLGGSIAYEAAQQLVAAGENVALLALFDTMNWHYVRYGTWLKISRGVHRLIFHAASLGSLDTEGRREFLKAKFNEMRRRIPVWRVMWLTRLNKSISEADPQSTLLAKIWRTNHAASRRYIPKAYPGALTDFRPASQYWALRGPDLKWDKLAMGGQRIVVVPVLPGMMLVEPLVRHLAVALRSSIDEEISRWDTRNSEEVRGESVRVAAN